MNVRARFFIEKDPRDATLGKLAPSSVVFSHPAREVGGAPDVSFLEFLTPQYIDLMHEYCGQFSAACPAGGGTADAPLRPKDGGQVGANRSCTSPDAKSHILFCSEQRISPTISTLWAWGVRPVLRRLSRRRRDGGCATGANRSCTSPDLLLSCQI